MFNNGIPVSEHTEKLLASRKDDFRIDMIHDIMFGDDIGGLFPNRTIKMAGEDGKDDVDVVICKASYLDTYAYLKSSVDSMKLSIEQNIQNISRLRENGEGISAGVPPIKDVWLFVFIYDNDEIKVNSYINPNSQDIGEILRTDKMIVMTGFILTYPTAFPGQQLPEGYPDTVYEWTFISPIMEEHLAEASKCAIDFEAENMKKMFFLDFQEGVKAIKDELTVSQQLKNM